MWQNNYFRKVEHAIKIWSMPANGANVARLVTQAQLLRSLEPPADGERGVSFRRNRKTRQISGLFASPRPTSRHVGHFHRERLPQQGGFDTVFGGFVLFSHSGIELGIVYTFFVSRILQPLAKTVSKVRAIGCCAGSFHNLRR